ncbi:hypothetical protein [Snuella lapsa]|uniref:Uncharacterized protein n=1 Tax=Snuella lapsa TaxID=870481 RepID=A0ABP6WZI0_9FLAO
MIKDLVKIIGIISFFTAIGYALTYPYEVKFNGTDDIVLIEDYSNYNSLDQIINHPKLQNSILYITVWEPLKNVPVWFGRKDYEKRIEELTLKLAEKNEKDLQQRKKDSAQLNHLTNGKTTLVKDIIKFENYVSGLNSLYDNYNDKNVKIVFVDYPNTDSNRKADDIRKWKKTIQQYQIKGYHFLASPKLITDIREHIKAKDAKLFFPYRILVNTGEQYINYNAPAVILEQETLYKNLDILLNKENYDDTLSR